MNLSEPFIRRPVMTLLLMATILFFGFFAYRALPVSDLPNVDMPTIQVSVSYPGASPETMANAIATPLEQQFMTIQGIDSIFSSSNSGSTDIVLQFQSDRDIDSASTDVQAAINRAQPNLPSNLPNYPTYDKVNPAATPILYYAIHSKNMTLSQLYDYAYTFVGERLSMVEGVSQVITYGSPYAVRIQVDPEKLAAKNIGLDQVTAIVQQNNVNLPLGTLYGEKDDYTIDADGQLMRAPAYEEVVIKNQNGDLVKIKEIGRAIDSVQNDKYFQHFVTKDRDEHCIILAIQRLPGKNTIQIIQNVKKTLKTLTEQMPKTLKIETIYDKSDSIGEGVREVKLTLVIALMLVVAVIYFFLGKIGNTIIPSLVLPLSILGTFAVMYLLHYSIDILSLLALTLCIGFLVDDAIVVMENNERHVQMGSTPFEAALIGSREISTTILSMTLCLAASFIPMIFMGGVVGKLFREFAVTIMVAVLISGFLSLSLTPMLSSRFIQPAPENRIVNGMRNLYKPCLLWAMRHRFLMLCVGIFSIVASFLLFILLPTDFLPPDDVGFIQGFTLSRDGTSPNQMNQYHSEINKIAIDDPNVDSILSISSFTNANEGIVFFRLKPYKSRASMNSTIDELTKKFQHLPGVNVYLSPLPLIDLQVGTTASALYQFSLNGIDRKALYNYAPKLLNQMKANPIFTQVSSDLRINQPQWEMQILRDKAASFNVRAADIEYFLQFAYSNNKISQINADINQYDVLIETLPRFYKDPTVLSKLYIRSSNNDLVPLSELVQVSETVGPLTVNHINGLPTVGISFNLKDHIPLGTALKALDKLTQGQMPSQIYGNVIGTAKVFKASFKTLPFLLLLSFFVIYVILGILYESFIHPLTVMSALPPALLGGLATLFIFRHPLSLYSFVGLILLIGIVLKNGIMLVDFANDAITKEKKSAHDAIIEAALIRFRPILMTTICAGMGALPIAIGMGGAIAHNRIPLGLCIVGGLLFSQLLTLMLTPVLYYYFEMLQEKFRRNK